MRNTKKIIARIFAAVVLPALFGLAACKKLSSYDYPPGAGSAYDIITADVSFSYFKTIVDKAGLADMLKGGDAYTVFVPSNNAFIASGYPLTLLQTMPAADLSVLVKNHMLAGKIDIKTVTGVQTAVSGRKLLIQSLGSAYYADGGDITNPDEETTNGFVHFINKVLVTAPTLMDAIGKYSNATANSQLSFLAAAITRASTGSTNFTTLLTGSDQYTLLAPNNGAFIDGGYATLAAVQAAQPDVLGNMLKYQLIQGAKLTTAFDSIPVNAMNGNSIYFDRSSNSARTTLWYANGILFGNTGSPNIMAGNGVLHTVSRLLPTPVTMTTWDRIQSDANLSLFYTLIQRAATASADMNFQNMLSGANNSYTVFAINNAGLTAAGYGTTAAINAESPAVLANIVKLHIIPKRINNINIAENGTVGTLLKTTDASGNTTTASLTFTQTGGFKIKGASNTASVPVVTANLVTTNGLLNIIGTVLTP